MKRLMSLALLVGLTLAGSAPAWAWITSPGYSTTESTHTVFEHAVYEYYFNNSGAALTSGAVVVFDRTGTGVNVGVGSTLTTVPTGASRAEVDVDGTDGDVTNVGTYITTTTTADLAATAGVVDDNSCADQTYCRVQVWGPRLVLCANSTDLVSAGSAVGSTTVASQMGGGNGLGVAISACHNTAPATDFTVGWVFIRPGGND